MGNQSSKKAKWTSKVPPANKDAAVFWECFVDKFFAIESTQLQQLSSLDIKKKLLLYRKQILTLVYGQLFSIAEHRGNIAIEMRFGTGSKSSATIRSPTLRRGTVTRAGRSVSSPELIAPSVSTGSSAYGIFIDPSILNVVTEGIVSGLVTAIQASPNLIVLRLTEFKIPAPVITSLVDTLAVNKSLQLLDLSGNDLGDEMAKSIIEALKANSQIEKLYLNRTGVGDQTSLAIAQLLTETKYLHMIELKANAITEAGYNALRKVTVDRPHIVKLHLEDNPLGEEKSTKIKSLEKILARNQAVNEVMRILMRAIDEYMPQRKFSKKIQTFNQSLRARAAKASPNTAMTGTESAYKILSQSLRGEMAEKIVATTHIPSKRFACGIIEDIGMRSTMEDVVLCHGVFRSKETEDLFAVFDGHGGKDCAEYAARTIPKKLAESLEKNIDPLQAFATIFQEMHKEVAGWAVYCGTTACVVLIVGDTLYLGNVGDSRAILCRKDKPLRISVDHNLQVEEEVDRIKNLGGVITEGNPPRIKGMISITRAIGDSMLHPFIIAEPYTAKIPITKDDLYVVMASDGLWEKVPEEQVSDVVLNSNDPQVAASKLKALATENGSEDNISIIVVKMS